MSKNIKQVIVVRSDLKMRKGKIGAQCAHASMKFLLEANESRRIDELRIKLTDVEAQWMSGSFTKIVVGVDSEAELRDLMFHAQMKGVECHSIIDAGKTEFHGIPTLTCAAFGPANEDDINEITGKLKLI